MDPLQIVGGILTEQGPPRSRAHPLRERSDVCAVPAAGVVAEQVVAWVLAVELLRMLGGDTVTAVRHGADSYRTRLAGF